VAAVESSVGCGAVSAPGFAMSVFYSGDCLTGGAVFGSPVADGGWSFAVGSGGRCTGAEQSVGECWRGSAAVAGGAGEGSAGAGECGDAGGW